MSTQSAHRVQKTFFGPQHLSMVVDLDERGSFCAHVENQNGKSIFEFTNEDESGWPGPLWLVEDGFMRHARDTAGLLEYLQDVGLAKPTATLTISG